MRDLDATKLRLVREAVRENVEGPSRARPTVGAARPRFTLFTVLSGSFLIASLLYLAMPPTMPPRVSEASAHTAKPNAVALAMPTPVATATAVTTPVAAVTPALRTDVVRVTPLRPSRAVLPLAVRRIVLDPGHGGT